MLCHFLVTLFNPDPQAKNLGHCPNGLPANLGSTCRAAFFKRGEFVQFMEFRRQFFMKRE
jgi:hypothetical protein